jgi:hypothetical protein
VWGPAFEQAGFPWLRDFPIEDVFAQQRDGRWWCKCCEDFLTDYGPDFPILTAHTRHHKFEYRELLVDRERERREQAAQLKIGDAA